VGSLHLDERRGRHAGSGRRARRDEVIRPAEDTPYGRSLTTSTWWRCWPARTAASPACRGNGTRSAPPASPPSKRYGLRSTAPADRTAARRPSRAETEKAARRKLDDGHPRVDAAPPGHHRRRVLRQRPGVLRPPGGDRGAGPQAVQRKNPGQVTGYAGRPARATLQQDGGPVWYGGGKLAADLTWPKLRQRWIPPRTAPGRAHLNLTTAERNAIWDHAAQAAAGGRRADPSPGRHEPGCRRGRRVGCLRHPARGRRRARQSRPAPGRRRLRPRRPRPVRPHPRRPPRPGTNSATPPG